MEKYSFYLNNKLSISIFLISLFHFSGLIGIQSSYKDWFLNYTPLNLILSTVLLFWNQENINKKSIIAFGFVFLLGLVIEIIGVKTGIIFGSYVYGETFGYKFMNVPVIIGLNWASLSFASTMLFKSTSLNLLQKALISSLIPISIDFFIEKLCHKLDFWYWKDNVIPIQNFISWYLFSFLFSLILLKNNTNSTNRFAKYFLSIQFLFFILLNISLL
jgi:putative membrane protein